MKPLTPHDRFFRAFLGSELNNARDLVRSALPAEVLSGLDLSELTVSKDSFVDHRLRAAQSDLLLRARGVEGEPVLIYILVEHKGWPERWAVLQLLRYMAEIWWREVEGRKDRRTGKGRSTGKAGRRGRGDHGQASGAGRAGTADQGEEEASPAGPPEPAEPGGSGGQERRISRLPVIIPLIFSQSPAAWHAPVRLGEYFRVSPQLSRYIPGFEAVLYSLERLPQGVQSGLAFRAGLLLMRGMMSDLRRALPEVLSLLSRQPLDQGMRLFLEEVLEYTVRAGVLGEAEIEAAIRESGFQESREVFMTLAEKLIEKGRKEGEIRGRQEGRREGEARGRQEAMREARQQMLARLLSRSGGLSAGERAVIEAAEDLERLDRAIDAALDGAAREAVLATLA